VIASGRVAHTRYRSLAEFEGFSFILAMPLTGRTHQIRVHFASMGCPVAGDATYGRPEPFLARQFLHASFVRFARPSDSAPLELHSQLPEDLRSALATVVDVGPSRPPDTQACIDEMVKSAVRQFHKQAGVDAG
jgi:23S rRNA pseudouridine1911/1915/1917 synthase